MRLIGIVSLGSPVLVLMEIMELGDLKAYLRSIRPKVRDEELFVEIAFMQYFRRKRKMY